MINRVQLFLRDPESEAAATEPVLLLIERLVRGFPSLEIGVARAGGRPGLALVDAAAWASPRCDVSAFDARMAVYETDSGPLDVAGDVAEIGAAASEALTRYQRFIERRNTASRGAVFDRLFRLHQERAAREAPHRRRRYLRARDVHHWTLRVEPHASLAVQAAALFLDVARLDASPGEEADVLARIWEDARIERFVSEEALALVRALDIDDDDGGEHDAVPNTDLSILRDADALALLSLESADVLDGYGVEVTEERLGAALARMTPRAHELLPAIRLRSDVAELTSRLAPRKDGRRPRLDSTPPIARAS